MDWITEFRMVRLWRITSIMWKRGERYSDCPQVSREIVAGDGWPFKIDVVPSRNIVVIRIGEAPDNSLVPRAFHDEMWAKINSIILPVE